MRAHERPASSIRDSSTHAQRRLIVGPASQRALFFGRSALSTVIDEGDASGHLPFLAIEVLAGPARGGTFPFTMVGPGSRAGELALRLIAAGQRRFPSMGASRSARAFVAIWHSGLGCCHPFGLDGYRPSASMRSAGRVPIICTGSWPW